MHGQRVHGPSDRRHTSTTLSSRQAAPHPGWNGRGTGIAAHETVAVTLVTHSLPPPAAQAPMRSANVTFYSTSQWLCAADCAAARDGALVQRVAQPATRPRTPPLRQATPPAGPPHPFRHLFFRRPPSPQTTDNFATAAFVCEPRWSAASLAVSMVAALSPALP
jgi:hypothetical protein